MEQLVMGRFYPYATDSAERARLPFYFACLAILIAYAIHVLLRAARVDVPWALDLPIGPIALYGAISGLFAKYAWRWRLWRVLSLVQIPDLNGEFEGWFTTSHEEHRRRHSCTLHISQTWTTISIRARFEESESSNMISGISVADRRWPRLMYEYENTPKADATETMHPHFGTVQFTVDLDHDMMDGTYYTGRGRETVGRLEVRRVK